MLKPSFVKTFVSSSNLKPANQDAEDCCSYNDVENVRYLEAESPEPGAGRGAGVRRLIMMMMLMMKRMIDDNITGRGEVTRTQP